MSLRELQLRFAAALGDPQHRDAGLAVYRRAIGANYRKALAASYPVVKALVGDPFFDAAVDSYVEAHPSRGGDLNLYGDRFASFLASYPYAASLPYLGDVARLEWAIDEAARASDASGSAQDVIAALSRVPPEQLGSECFALHPSCRFIESAYPVLRIWQIHQSDFEGDPAVSFDAGTDYLLVRRGDAGVLVERLVKADFAWLAALTGGEGLASATDAALSIDAEFDLSAALRVHIASGSLVGTASEDERNGRSRRPTSGL